MNQIAVESIVNDLIRLTTDLRLGVGLDLCLANKLIREMYSYAEQIVGEDHVPKVMAGVFLDAYPSIESFANQYDETAAKNIRHVSDMVGVAIREILTR